jgi:hypothetical protein
MLQPQDTAAMVTSNPDQSDSSGRTHSLIGVPRWIHGFAWGGMIVLTLMVAGIIRSYQGKDVWRGWVESVELRRPAYAERVYPDDVLRTRSDTWSNLAYVLVGFYALALGLHDLRRQAPANAGYLIHTPALSILFGAACCFLGFGSGLFHASLTRWGQQLDVAAMYSPLVVFIAINVGRWVPRLNAGDGRAGIPTWPILAGLALITCFFLYEYKWSMRSSVVLPTLILIVAAFVVVDRFQRRRRMSVPLMLLSLAALVAARICWVMDVKGTFSGPDTWLQGHAVWHLLTALSLATIYLYYRNEEL